jgi:hypothetical protein
MMLAHSLQRGLKDAADDGVPKRRSRRTPLIEAALEPAAGNSRRRRSTSWPRRSPS